MNFRVRLCVALVLILPGFAAKADWNPSNEDFALATKIVEIMKVRCAGTPAPKPSYPATVAFLRGSPFDGINAPEAGDRLLWLIKKVGEMRNYKLQTDAVHHTSWRSVCDLAQQTPDARTVLVGHSYGASGVVKVAKCLESQNLAVSGLLTISSYDLLAGVDVTAIPANVDENLNFYTNDASIPGYKDHKAIDPAATRVRNMLAEYNDSGWAHLNIGVKLVPLLALQAAYYIEGRPEPLLIPDKFDTQNLEARLDEFHACP